MEVASVIRVSLLSKALAVRFALVPGSTLAEGVVIVMYFVGAGPCTVPKEIEAGDGVAKGDELLIL